MTPHGSDGEGERDSQVMKAVWQHALELQAEIQLRTFQEMVNMNIKWIQRQLISW